MVVHAQNWKEFVTMIHRPGMDSQSMDDAKIDKQHNNKLELNALRDFMCNAVPYWKTLGLELIEVSPGYAVFEAEVRPGLLTERCCAWWSAGVDSGFSVCRCRHLAGLPGKLRHHHQSSSCLFEAAQSWQVPSHR